MNSHYLMMTGLLVCLCVTVVPVSAAINAYVTNWYDNSVSVIDTATNTVNATVPVGRYPLGVGVTPDGSKVYVGNHYDRTISVIDGTNNTVISVIPVELNPGHVAVTPDGSTAYITENPESNSPVNVLVISSSKDAVVGTIPIPAGNESYFLAFPSKLQTQYSKLSF